MDQDDANTSVVIVGLGRGGNWDLGKGFGFVSYVFTFFYLQENVAMY